MKERKSLTKRKTQLLLAAGMKKKMLLYYECMIIWPHQNPIQETFNFQYTQTNTVLKSNDIIKKETNKTKNLISFLCMELLLNVEISNAKPFPWSSREKNYCVSSIFDNHKKYGYSFHNH